MTNNRLLTIRLAAARDAGTVERLAALDSAAPLTGRILLAESDGVALAAVSLETGAVTADPFQRTADAVRMLTLRRYQLMRQGGDVAPARALLRRLAHGAA
jgi:hypothetical protein